MIPNLDISIVIIPLGIMERNAILGVFGKGNILIIVF
jgi:hypothetical protein